MGMIVYNGTVKKRLSGGSVPIGRYVLWKNKIFAERHAHEDKWIIRNERGTIWFQQISELIWEQPVYWYILRGKV